MFKIENKMIAHIEGILESKLPNQVIIDVNGIGYLLHISSILLKIFRLKVN